MTAQELENQIVALLGEHGFERAKAILYIDAHSSPTSWPSIEDKRLRSLIENYRLALADRVR
jgi:hypothetical protein